MTDNDLIQKNQDDFIRRGDAMAAVRTSDFRWEAEDAIAALPPAKLDNLASGKAVTVGVDPRIINLNAEALAEIKATVDGQSDQPVKAIIYGLLAEIAALEPVAAPLDIDTFALENSND